MTPVVPIVPGHDLPVIVFGKDQPEYMPLPAYRSDEGVVITRWRMTWRERWRVFWSGNIWLHVHTFNRLLQPVLLETTAPQVSQL